MAWSKICHYLSNLRHRPAALFDLVFLIAYAIIAVVFFARYRRLVLARPSKTQKTLPLPSCYPWEAIAFLVLLPVRLALHTTTSLKNAVINHGGWVSSISQAWSNASLNILTIMLLAFVVGTDRLESYHFRKYFLARYEEFRRQEGTLLPIKEKIKDDLDEKDDHIPGQITKTITISVSSSSHESFIDDNAEQSRLLEQENKKRNEDRQKPFWKRALAGLHHPKTLPPATATHIVARYYCRAFLKAFLAQTYISVLLVSLNETIDDGRIIKDDPSLWFSSESSVPLSLMLCAVSFLGGIRLTWTGMRFASKARDELVL